MHIGHNEDDLDHENLALRHLGEGIHKERSGRFHEALSEYMMANVLDPRLEVARTKLNELITKLELSLLSGYDQLQKKEDAGV